MNGITIVVIGAMLLAGSTAGMAAAEWILHVKKRRMREEVYHIYG